MIEVRYETPPAKIGDKIFFTRWPGGWRKALGLKRGQKHLVCVGVVTGREHE